MRFTVDPHEHLVQVPLPVRICAHLADPFLADLCGKQRTKVVPPETNRFMADVDADTVDIDAIRNDRDKIWSAAKALYDAGEQWWLTSAEESLAQNQQLRRAAMDPLFDEVAEWLETSKTIETCMREVWSAVTSEDEDTSAAKMSPQLQHRLRGVLNAAGFKSAGQKFTSGEHKGMMIFALPLPEPKLPL